MATQQSRSNSLERYAPLSGALFAVLLVLAFGSFGDSAEPGQAAGIRSDAYVDDPEKALMGGQLLGLAAFSLAWFGGSLRQALVGAHERLAALAYGGTLLAAAMLLAGAATHGALGLRADEVGALDPEVAGAVGDVGTLFIGAVAPIGMALVALATALASLRTGALLPKWAAWVTLVLGIGLLALPINWALTVVFAAWALVVGIALTARGGGGTSRSND